MPIPPPNFARFYSMVVGLSSRLNALKRDENYLILISAGLPSVDDPTYPQLNGALTQLTEKLNDGKKFLLKALVDLDAIEANQIKYNLKKPYQIKQLQNTCDRYRNDIRKVLEQVDRLFKTLFPDQEMRRLLEVLADTLSKLKQDLENKNSETSFVKKELQAELETSLSKVPAKMPQRSFPMHLPTFEVWVLIMCALILLRRKSK